MAMQFSPHAMPFGPGSCWPGKQYEPPCRSRSISSCTDRRWGFRPGPLFPASSPSLQPPANGCSRCNPPPGCSAASAQAHREPSTVSEKSSRQLLPSGTHTGPSVQARPSWGDPRICGSCDRNREGVEKGALPDRWSNVTRCILFCKIDADLHSPCGRLHPITHHLAARTIHCTHCRESLLSASVPLAFLLGCGSRVSFAALVHTTSRFQKFTPPREPCSRLLRPVGSRPRAARRRRSPSPSLGPSTHPDDIWHGAASARCAAAGRAGRCACRQPRSSNASEQPRRLPGVRKCLPLLPATVDFTQLIQPCRDAMCSVGRKSAVGAHHRG